MKNRKTAVAPAVWFLLVILAVLFEKPADVFAAPPYKTYTEDGYGQMREMQSAYLPSESMIGFGNQRFDGASDICIGANGWIYVADTGNHRILVGDSNRELKQVVGAETLTDPRGVYVTENRHIYVADRGNGREDGAVYEFDESGSVLNRYGRPDSPLYGEDQRYMPVKLTVNKTGVMFVICESNTNGAAEISPADGGTFLGYYGANYAKPDLKMILLRAILTDKQREKLAGNRPSSPDNLAMDEKGMIDTITRGDAKEYLKRLNIAGINRIKTDVTGTMAPAAVVPGNHENIYVADSSGYILEYSDGGELLFVFGGTDDHSQRAGLLKNVTAIACDRSDVLYVMEADQNRIQTYHPTEITKWLNQARDLYAKGRYKKSMEPLREVLNANRTFAYANRAMGRACFGIADYEQALEYAKRSNDREGYSDAYWELRNLWLRKNLFAVILIVGGGILVCKILQIYKRKSGIYEHIRSCAGKHRFLRELAYAGYFMRHPVNASYGIAREGRDNWGTSTFIMVVFTAEYIGNKYFCGFLQRTVREGEYEVGLDIISIAAGVLLLVICNYLVCSIREGEGTLRGIYTYFCYGLLPGVCIFPLSFLFSHVLTINEQFLITLCGIVGVGWMAVLVVLGMKEVNNYTAKETAAIIFLTFFCAVILVVLVFIGYVLGAQVIQFVETLSGEVVNRLGW